MTVDLKLLLCHCQTPHCSHPEISDCSSFVSPTESMRGRGDKGGLAWRLTEVLHMERR